MYIYMRITVDGIVRELSTKRLWEPSKWNSKAGRARGIKEDIKTLNTYLDTLRAKVYEVKRMLLEGGKPVTADALKNALSGKDGKGKWHLKYFNVITSKSKN